MKSHMWVADFSPLPSADEVSHTGLWDGHKDIALRLGGLGLGAHGRRLERESMTWGFPLRGKFSLAANPLEYPLVTYGLLLSSGGVRCL